MPERKRIRLPRAWYRGRQCFFVTVCCENRRPVFKDAKKAEWVLSQLLAESAAQGFALHAWCVMPDHLHLIVQGSSESSDLLSFIIRFKQKTAREALKKYQIHLWQRSFYDHRLRDDAILNRVAWYIWMNPVRKGLYEAPEEYPFSGSNTLEWIKSPRPPEWIPPWKLDTAKGRG